MNAPLSRPQNTPRDKAVCPRCVRVGSICLTCDCPPRVFMDGFPHHLVDFELWLHNQHQALSAFGGQFSHYQAQMVSALALIDQFRSQSAINFGDDVNTAPTSPTVPVGNTGTTSTGHAL